MSIRNLSTSPLCTHSPRVSSLCRTSVLHLSLPTSWSGVPRSLLGRPPWGPRLRARRPWGPSNSPLRPPWDPLLLTSLGSRPFRPPWDLPLSNFLGPPPLDLPGTHHHSTSLGPHTRLGIHPRKSPRGHVRLPDVPTKSVPRPRPQVG